MNKKHFLIIISISILSVGLIFGSKYLFFVTEKNSEPVGDQQDDLNQKYIKKKYVLSDRKDVFLELIDEKKYNYKDRTDDEITNQGSYAIHEDKIVLNGGTTFVIKDGYIVTEDEDISNYYKVFFDEEVVDSETKSIEVAIQNWLKDVEDEHPELPRMESSEIEVSSCYYAIDNDIAEKNMTCVAKIKLNFDYTFENFESTSLDSLIVYAGEGLYYDDGYIFGGGIYSLNRTSGTYKVISRGSSF